MIKYCCDICEKEINKGLPYLEIQRYKYTDIDGNADVGEVPLLFCSVKCLTEWAESLTGMNVE